MKWWVEIFRPVSPLRNLAAWPPGHSTATCCRLGRTVWGARWPGKGGREGRSWPPESTRRSRLPMRRKRRKKWQDSCRIETCSFLFYQGIPGRCCRGRSSWPTAWSLSAPSWTRACPEPWREASGWSGSHWDSGGNGNPDNGSEYLFMKWK